MRALFPWTPDGVLDFVAMYLIHSTLIFGTVWFAQLRSGARLREALWKASLVLPLMTTTARLAWPGLVDAPAWSLPQLEMGTGRSELGELPPGVVAATDSPAHQDPTHVGAVSPGVALRSAGDDRRDPWEWILAGALLFSISRVVAPAIALTRLLRRREPVATGPLVEELQQLRRQAGLRRRVRLYTLAGIASPAAAGTLRPAIYLPARTQALSAELCQPLLAHELAHHRRLDPLWSRLTHGIVAFFFFQPLHLVARRHTAACAELLADDLAIHWTRDGAALASSLTEVAAWTRPSRELRVGVPMVRRRALGALRVRIERALDRPREISAAFGLPAAGLLCLASLALMPALARARTAPADDAYSAPTPYELAIGRNLLRLEDLESSRPELQARIHALKSALADLRPGTGSTPRRR